ncbi:MAG: P-II family nitrogen regulator [Peptococcaceae bacterium]|nr:P-II family nitrogen regulator [Peptococcaceae bacterium]
MGENGFKLIITIVSKGKAGKVLDVAHKAGAVGGTILYGHGSSVRLMLGISIEPEKEIVLTLIDVSQLEKVMNALVSEMELNEPNKGVSFVVPLDQVVGLYQGPKE